MQPRSHNISRTTGDSMSYWEPRTEFSKYAPLQLVDETQHRQIILPLLYDTPARRKDDWVTPSVRFQSNAPSLPALSHQSNFPGLYALPAWDAKAIELLNPLVENSVEYLPLDCDEGEFWLVNVLDVADCLDSEQSEFFTLEADGKQGVRHYVHKPGCLEGHHIFRTPEHRYKRIFVSDEFKALVENSDLVGLKFVSAPWERKS